jgi:hypothetical protein
MAAIRDPPMVEVAIVDNLDFYLFLKRAHGGEPL